MKVVVAILSDIHFSASASHPIPGRVSEIAAAIASAEVKPEAILLLFAGDIAEKGNETEYNVAQSFIAALRALLHERFPGTHTYAVSVPGNHDLKHEDDSEDYRRNAVEGSAGAISNPLSNEYYLKQLLTPQHNYWDFAKSLDFPASDVKTMICRSVSIKFSANEIHVNLINTALLSQIHESQGSLLLPLPLLSETLCSSCAPSLTITVMHHPIFWIESQTLTKLRDLLGHTSDYLITGHEHFSSGYEVKSDLGDSIRYFESPAVFDPKKPNHSAFRVLAFDLKSFREKQILFEWSSTIYKSKTESTFEWRDLSMNRIARQSFMMNASALKRLNDPGFAAPARPNRPINLLEIFEYPDVKIQDRAGAKKVQIKKGHQLLSFVSQGGIKEVHGAPLSGKTTLSKALVLDMLLKGKAIPIWLDGNTLQCNSVDDFEARVRSAFKELYSPEQADLYNQLHPDRRSIVIDDWHLATISTATKDDIYDWMCGFAQSSILLVDANYQIRELLATGQATRALTDSALREITHVDISSLRHVTKASLIHKYLKLSNHKIETPEESKESKQIEDLVSQMLDTDRLPAFPFFVLCMLQAIEGKRTNAIAGGSHGPLYEVLILSALTKQDRDDPQVSNKIVFLQEIAFQMWSTKMSVMTPAEIRSVMDRFTQTTYQTLPTDRFLAELTEEKILSRGDGNFSFAYAQYLYYFIARYIRDHVDEDTDGTLRKAVDTMIDEISSVENSAIVMFLIYFEKDKNRIIDRLVANAACIFKTVIPASLEGDAAEFVNPTKLDMVIEDNPNIARNRHEARAFRDEREEKKLFEPMREIETSVRSAYRYADDLPEHCKLHLVTQCLTALGQVIRNFSANLPGPRKVEVLRETYLVALRSLSRVMELCKGVINAVGSLERPTTGEVSFLKLKRATDDLFTLLPQIYAVSMCNAVSGSVGIANMDRAYIETAKSLDQSVAVRLIDLNIQMNYFEGFPEQAIRDLSEDVKGNLFATQVLEVLVLSYFLMNNVEEGTRKRTILLLGFKPRDIKPPAD
jgi:hypothetical protein